MTCFCTECFLECCNIDDTIMRNKRTPIAKKIVSWALLGCIGLFLILVGIFNIKYFSKLQPYFMRAGGYAMFLALLAIVLAAASFLALFFLVLYFLLGLCDKNGSCVWGFFNFLLFALFILQIVVYALGTMRERTDDLKCSKPLSECYNGMYNETLGKIDYHKYDEERIKELIKEWKEFLDWYHGKIDNLDQICGKALSSPLAVAIIQFIFYITLLMIYGGWDCVRERLCVCCCCHCCDFDCETCWNCEYCTSKTQVSNERSNDENKPNSDDAGKYNDLVPNQNDQNVPNDQNASINQNTPINHNIQDNQNALDDQNTPNDQNDPNIINQMIAA